MSKTLTKSASEPKKLKPAKVQAKSPIPSTRFIPPEVDAELTPLTRAFVHSLFDRIDELTKRVEILEAKLAAKLTPQNSSLPPSTQHPHAKPLSKKPKSALPSCVRGLAYTTKNTPTGCRTGRMLLPCAGTSASTIRTFSLSEVTRDTTFLCRRQRHPRPGRHF